MELIERVQQGHKAALAMANAESFDMDHANTKRFHEHHYTSGVFSFVKKMQFDINNGYVVGYGGHDFFIMNLSPNCPANRRVRVYSISHYIYSHIMTIQFCSGGKLKKEHWGQMLHKNYQFAEGDSDEIKCYIACKKRAINQILVYDYFEE